MKEIHEVSVSERYVLFFSPLLSLCTFQQLIKSRALYQTCVPLTRRRVRRIDCDFADKWLFQTRVRPGEHDFTRALSVFTLDRLRSALLALISVSPGIMCSHYAPVCWERHLLRLARLDRGEDLTPGLRPCALFNEIIESAVTAQAQGFRLLVIHHFTKCR